MGSLPPRPSPGLLYVGAHFTDPALSHSAFDSWYNNEHIPHLLSMSGVHSALRFVQTASPLGPDSHLAIYPLKDTAWVHSAEFLTAIDSTESAVLPGGSVFHSVDFDGRCYDLVQKGDTPGGEGRGGDDPPAAYQLLEYYHHRDGDAARIRSLRREQLGCCDGYLSTKEYVLPSPQREEWEQKWRDEDARPSAFLAIHEFANERDGEKARGGKGEEVGYRLTGAFGEGVWVS